MLRCARCRSRVWPGQNYCPRCGLRLSAADVAAAPDDAHAEPDEPRAPDAPRLRPSTVRLGGQLAGSALAGVVSGLTALVLAFLVFDWDGSEGHYTVTVVTPIAFDRQASPGVVNASALVPIADSRYLVVDDQTDDAFYELVLGPDGKQVGPLARREIAGLAHRAVEDFEAAALVEEAGQRLVVAISSLETYEGESTEDGFVRVRFGPDGSLSGEVMAGFREWLLANAPELSTVRGGPAKLDVQGLIWDPARHALLIGVRTATESGRPLVLPLKVKDWGGPWETSNLEVLPLLRLDVGDAKHPLGVRELARHPRTGRFLLILANDGPPETFELYTWDGGAKVARMSKVVFAPGMRPEGLAYGQVGGRPALVFADDNGGFYVTWDDGPSRA